MIAITGTPGTGKTTVADALRSKGYDVLDLNSFIRDNGLLGEFDAQRGTYDVDVVALRAELAHLGPRTLVEGHLSHFLDCDSIIVLRCAPSVLYGRLKGRGYGEDKVLENVQAEALDVILCESVDSGRPVYEMDCTSDIDTIISGVEDILAGNTEGRGPGSVDWSEEMVRWC